METLIEPGSSILEFGCNDGVLLAQLQRQGFNCVGVDASDNVASMARANGLDVRTGFFTPSFVDAQDLAGRFDLITCSNVFAHIDNIGETTAAIRKALKPGGLFIVEVHDGDKLVKESQFDTIYHEHLTYFTEETLGYFLDRQGFDEVECIRTPMHGGALRFVARMRGQNGASEAAQPLTTRRLEGGTLEETINRCAADIRALFDLYGPLDGYGAAGRAQMFINMTKTADCFARVFDDSTLRRNRYIVGTDIPIMAFDGSKRGDACVILAWNYAETIAGRISEHYRNVSTVLPSLTRW